MINMILTVSNCVIHTHTHHASNYILLKLFFANNTNSYFVYSNRNGSRDAQLRLFAGFHLYSINMYNTCMCVSITKFR